MVHVQWLRAPRPITQQLLALHAPTGLHRLTGTWRLHSSGFLVTILSKRTTVCGPPAPGSAASACPC